MKYLEYNQKMARDGELKANIKKVCGSGFLPAIFEPGKALPQSETRDIRAWKGSPTIGDTIFEPGKALPQSETRRQEKRWKKTLGVNPI